MFKIKAIMFINTPILIISLNPTSLKEYTSILGGVAMGRIKAPEAEMATTAAKAGASRPIPWAKE